jgi:hypothetical protein
MDYPLEYFKTAWSSGVRKWCAMRTYKAKQSEAHLSRLMRFMPQHILRSFRVDPMIFPD